MSKWLSFLNSNQNVVEKPILENVPEHIAIIMDGNGRWASKKGLPRVAGHKEGMTVVRKIVRAAVAYDVKILTLYAFSTENWKRPKLEVDFLMRLPKEFSHIYLPEMIENNVRIETIGEFDTLPTHTKNAINHAKKMTEKNDGLLLNIALNYGGRDEIIRAIKHVVHDVDKGNVDIKSLNEEVFSKYLYTNHMKDPDLLIRTSGEQRLSNFLMWQLAYAEFWFTDVMWPDFNEEIFEQALYDYQRRKRRYGGI